MKMISPQTGILADLSKHARYLVFRIDLQQEALSSLQAMLDETDMDQCVVGIGQSLVYALGKTVPGLRTFEAQSSRGFDLPSTPNALWCWLRGEDRGELYHRSRRITSALTPGFHLEDCIDSFLYQEDRDLSGYEDGTENPTGQQAEQVAVVDNLGAGMDGSSFVAVMQWQHDFETLDVMSQSETDNSIGRRLIDNEEFQEAPESAHVKRTAQESFDPHAFILRRSMPWAKEMNAGLYFVAFGNSFDNFEALLNRMLGYDDGVRDALFQFTRPINGAYYWCPPRLQNKLDLSLLGL